jgi:hypothetical protein
MVAKKNAKPKGSSKSNTKKTVKPHTKDVRKGRYSIAANPDEIITKDVGGRPIEWTEERIEVKTKALEKWIANPENYFFTKYLVEQDLDAKQVERLCQKSARFCQTVEKAKKVQELRLVEMAVSKKGDGNFIKFVLQNKAGWRDKTEISGDAANPLSIIMDRIAISSKNPLDDYDLE